MKGKESARGISEESRLTNVCVIILVSKLKIKNECYHLSSTTKPTLVPLLPMAEDLEKLLHKPEQCCCQHSLLITGIRWCFKHTES